MSECEQRRHCSLKATAMLPKLTVSNARMHSRRGISLFRGAIGWSMVWIVAFPAHTHLFFFIVFFYLHIIAASRTLRHTFTQLHISNVNDSYNDQKHIVSLYDW